MWAWPTVHAYQVSHEIIWCMKAKMSALGIRMLDGVVTDVKEARSFGYRVHHNDIYSCR